MDRQTDRHTARETIRDVDRPTRLGLHRMMRE